jgi:hypothetical protein
MQKADFMPIDEEGMVCPNCGGNVDTCKCFNCPIHFKRCIHSCAYYSNGCKFPENKNFHHPY